MLPTFIGIGAPKVATTWLFRCLDEHPDVFMAPAKETKFFDDETIEGRLAEYEAHFVGGDGARAVGEISTRYLASSRRAAERIRRHVPGARLFVALRNPVEQVYSHYWHLLRQNFHDGNFHAPLSLEEALERYADLLVRPARYAEHLRRWLRIFDRTELLVVLYDDIKERPGDVLRELYDFIGVDADFEPPSLNSRGSAARVGVSPRSERLGRLYAAFYRRANRYVYYPLKRAIGSWRADRLKEALRVRAVAERLFMRQGYPPMRPDTREALRERFAPDVKFVQELTGRDLARWSRPPASWCPTRHQRQSDG